MRVDDLCQELEALAAKRARPAARTRHCRAARPRPADPRLAPPGGGRDDGWCRGGGRPRPDRPRSATRGGASRAAHIDERQPEPASRCARGARASPARTDRPRLPPQHRVSTARILVDRAARRRRQRPRAAPASDTRQRRDQPAVERMGRRGQRPGVHRPRALDEGGDAPSGCTITVRTAGSVALCGLRSGDQLLGTRIMLDTRTGWSTLIGVPPSLGGRQPGGHWSWAVPSPDGRWVLAQWSGECERQTGLLISVADGSVHAVTGEAGTGWVNAPASEMLGWTVDGQAIFQLLASCDEPAVARDLSRRTCERSEASAACTLTNRIGVALVHPVRSANDEHDRNYQPGVQPPATLV